LNFIRFDSIFISFDWILNSYVKIVRIRNYMRLPAFPSFEPTPWCELFVSSRQRWPYPTCRLQGSTNRKPSSLVL